MIVDVFVPSNEYVMESLRGAEPDDVIDMGSAVKVEESDIVFPSRDQLGDHDFSCDLECVGVGGGVIVDD